MTYKQMILLIFNNVDNPNPTFTCQQMCKKLIELGYVPLNKRTYLSGAISTILRKMVKDKILCYSSTLNGPKGGLVYQLKGENDDYYM